MTAAFDAVVPADVLVVGSGVAGLSAALAARERRVIVLSKGSPDAGSTPWAQGGVAAPVGPDDSPELHARDTLAVGGGLNDRSAVRTLTGEASARIADLAAAGGRFDRGPGGGLALGREAGHSVHRILHADGDATGAEVQRALTAAAAASGIEVRGTTWAAELVVDGGRVIGLTARGPGGERLLFPAPAVILATGGSGRLWSHTTNPSAVTGDGIALAARAGAALADLEFVQFHPTALASGRDPMPLLTEALRGEGAVLVDETGERFMVSEHPDAELAPRDVVARAIWRRSRQGHGVFLDARSAVGSRFPTRFPTVFGICAEEGLDPRVDPIPVAPAAHYHMGGILTDLDGRASLPGLWAVGEAACTGVHGANRLASNSLLEGLVFGHRAGQSAAGAGRVRPAAVLQVAADPGPDPGDAPDIVAELRAVMWDRVGLVRDHDGLVFARDRIERLAEKLAPGLSEAHNMTTAARLITGSALARPESRGGHYRTDHPDADPAWARSLVVGG
jgi:L-aspartate oxidase